MERPPTDKQLIEICRRETLRLAVIMLRRAVETNDYLDNECRKLRHEMYECHDKSIKVLQDSIGMAANYQGVSANLRRSECRVWDLEQKVKEKEEIIKNLSLKGTRRGSQQ